jgi:uncharacterized protein DUF3224
MKNRARVPTVVLAALAMAIGQVAVARSDEREAGMTRQAKGPFDVKVSPVAQESFDGGTALGRYSLDKQLHGDIEGASKGEMLTAGTAVPGSAGYVAIERFEGTLDGRKGTFVLQHLASMAHGEQQMDIRVVPDSGTGELAGLAGTMRIVVEKDGKHFYELDYTLPRAQSALPPPPDPRP